MFIQDFVWLIPCAMSSCVCYTFNVASLPVNVNIFHHRKMSVLFWTGQIFLKTSAPSAADGVWTGDVPPPHWEHQSHRCLCNHDDESLALRSCPSSQQTHPLFEAHVCAVHLVQVPVDRALRALCSGSPRSERSCSEETVGFCRSPLHISLHFIMLPSSQHVPDCSREAYAKTLGYSVNIRKAFR